MALIVLDAGVLGLAVLDPNSPSQEGREFRAWFDRTSGPIHRFAIADVTRYEVMRGLLHKGATAKIRRFERLLAATLWADSTREVWDWAASLWAERQGEGKPLADPRSLDGDTILAATTGILMTHATDDEPVIVATTNVKHLAWFGLDARTWRDIPDSA